LFLTMSSKMFDISVSGIYTDLMRKFLKEGNEIYIVAPYERRNGFKTTLKSDNGIHTLNVKTLNVTKTNIIEKGIGQLLLEYQFRKAIKKYLSNVRFDLILYSTPPITFTKVIKAAKKQNPNAVTYLLLKDIFLQNALDINTLIKTGLKGILYRFFPNKEKELYKISDYIGCMSPANVQYIIKHNPEVNPEIVEIAPNSYEPVLEQDVNAEESEAIRKKYSLPMRKPIFIYGGKLGKPQGISFLMIECVNANKDREDCHFVVVGDGTEYPKLESWIKKEKPKSIVCY
ncbi:glycosyltransferase WbuB, partial [Macellibacteroides fermentans]|uniref:glycosyltransferase WbuB n=1 Tax=Macellibacteroides fermentans TaxID=879969 RepID=UPI002B3A036A|nr:glycosyltransferase WbuB [Macellibacteroides fermentans]